MSKFIQLLRPTRYVATHNIVMSNVQVNILVCRMCALQDNSARETQCHQQMLAQRQRRIRLNSMLLEA